MANDIRTFNKIIAGKSKEVYDYLPVVQAQGDFLRLNGIDVLVNSVRTLLLTPLGTYPFDPTFGSLLYRKVFDPLDSTSVEQIEYEVKQRIEQFDDRIIIEKVEIFTIGVDAKGLQVNVHIKRGDIKGQVTINLPGTNFQFGLQDE